MKQNFLLFFLAVFTATIALATPPAEEGRTIFQARCASCHNVNKIVVGPALAGVDQRHTIEWIIKFVQSSQGVIKSGDTAAVALFEKFNHTPMPDHPDLNAEAIKGIVDYIKSESKTSADAAKAPFAKPFTQHPAYLPLSGANLYFFSSLLAVIVLLIATLLAFVRVKEYERTGSNV